MMLIDLGRPAEAVVYLERAIALDPASAAAQEALTRARSALRSHALDGEQVLDV